eukprot:GHVS01016624.1.p1 GENE.GHVS01016624.1~~GHVS01016624.1.p1  ORF type:complete len:106 (-),score=9.18 GHVS01016624.1:75-392(-)
MLKLTRTLFAVIWKKNETSFSKKKGTSAALRKRTNSKPNQGFQDDVVMEGRKCLLMSLRRNKGVNWYNAQQVLKHLEVHQRAKPDITAELKVNIQLAVDSVRKNN